MADGIMGMFTTPQEIRQKQMEAERAAYDKAMMSGDAFMQGQAMGRRIGGSVGGMLGVTSPEVARAEELAKLRPEFSQMIDPNEMMTYAKNLAEAGFTEEAIVTVQKATELAKAMKGKEKTAQSTFGKQAADEGFVVGTPAFNRRVSELASQSKGSTPTVTQVPTGIAQTFVKAIQNEFEKGNLEKTNPELFKKLDSGWIFDEFDADALANDPLLQDIWTKYREGSKNVNEAVNSVLYGTNNVKQTTTNSDPFAGMPVKK